MPTYPIDETLAVGDGQHVEHHIALAQSANEHETDIAALQSGKADTAHTHAAGDVTSGTMATARLGSGTANSTTFLRGDQTWAAPPGGGGATWGSITGTLSSQTDLQAALDAKITGFADPNADRIVFWDDSAGAYAGLTASTGLSLSGTTLTVSAASETVSGRVELATAAEATTGTDTTRAVHPAGLKAVADTKAALSHTHAATDIASGTIATARLGSGTANSTTFLRGDNTWATPSGGGGSSIAPWPPLGTVGGTVNYTFAVPGSGAGGGYNLGPNNNAEVLMFYVGVNCSLRSFSARVETAGAAGCIVKFWLYREGSTGSIPDTLVADLGSIAGDATSNGTKVTLGSPLALTPGWHSILVGTNSAGTTPVLTGWSASVPPQSPGRTADLTRIDFAARSGTRAVGIDMTSTAPSTITWNAPTTTPYITDVSGGRPPVVALDFI